MSKEKFVRDKPHVSMGILIAVFSIISAVSLGLVIYDDVMTRSDSDGDSIPDNLEDAAKQALFFEVTDDTLAFRSYENDTTPTTGGHEVGHALGLSHDGLSSYLEVYSRLYDDISTGVPILEFGIKYDSLIEFIDIDSNGYFNPIADAIVGKTTLTNFMRVDFGYGIDGQPAYHSSYSTIGGMLKVDFYTSREHVLLGRQVGLLAPNELKSTLTITNYIPTTGGTSLALNLSLSSNHDLTFSSTDLTVSTSTGNYDIDYEWLDWAIIDDVNTIINTTVPSSPIPSNEGSIYLNFGQLSNLSYDPKLSWHLPFQNTFNVFDLPWSYIAMGSIAILMVVATTHVARKRPGRLIYTDIQIPPKKKKTTKAEKRIPNTIRHRDR